MTSFAFGQTVTLVHRTASGRDAYGNDVLAEAETVLTNVPAWPTSTREGDEATVYDAVVVFLPPGTNVQAIDSVRVFGNRYEVNGQPERFQSPFDGFEPGVPVALERVTG